VTAGVLGNSGADPPVEGVAKLGVTGAVAAPVDAVLNITSPARVLLPSAKRTSDVPKTTLPLTS
jgi:hypothetical protein